MKIQVLMENTAEGALCREHGLSLFLEVEGRKLLFDTGKSGRFLENADRMGVDVSAADLVVLSHGHYDHGGGLSEFLNRNQTAKVYVQETAFGSYYASRSDGTYEYSEYFRNWVNLPVWSGCPVILRLKKGCGCSAR